MSKPIYLGTTALHLAADKIKFDEIIRKGESCYKIANSDAMRPFFMSIVSNSNHWMFISSNGALTAGRKNSDQASSLIIPMIRLPSLAITLGQPQSFWCTKETRLFFGNPFLSVTKEHIVFNVTSIKTHMKQSCF